MSSELQELLRCIYAVTTRTVQWSLAEDPPRADSAKAELVVSIKGLLKTAQKLNDD